MQKDHEVFVPTAGHVKELYYRPRTSSCGSVRDGIQFRFAGEPCWVVSIETLRQIVRDEDARRAAANAEVAARHNVRAGD